jgi:7-carboxy-7-deazaguanine synthase
MKYPVMEHFYTIQGEGDHSGKPAYFIRLAGCDVGCVWCDVKESWHTEGYPVHSAEEMSQWVKDSGAEIVVLTGGEPAMYDCTPITRAIHEKGLKIHIETSAAHPIRGDFDWVCFSPKKFKAPLPDSGKLADELKVVVFNKSDFAWAESFKKEVQEDCALYLQAEWDKRDQMYPLIVEYVKDHPEWRISVQTHKYIDVP